MGKKKDRKKMIEETRNHRKMDKQMKINLRRKMGKGDQFKLTKEYMQYVKKFNEDISPLKVKLRDVKGDGNCLFRSIADQIDGNQSTHAFLREEACKHMENHKEFFSPFLDQDQDGNFQYYLNSMRKSGQWGGHLQLQALSQCFRCLIIVHKLNLQEYSVSPMTEMPKSIIHLGYFQHQDFEHYVSIRDINDDSQQAGGSRLENLNKKMYNYLISEEEEDVLLRKQLQELQVDDQREENGYKEENYWQQPQPQQQPFPNYPRNKKCKCGSKIQYKACCYKQWQKKMAK